MVEQKQYDVVYNALELACKFIKENNFTITKDNTKVLSYIANGSLTGHFLMESQNMLLQVKR